MKFRIIFILSLFIASVVFLSCKKYDYGPFISFKTKADRIQNKWKLIKITREDVDVTKSYLFNIKDYIIEFKDDGTVEKTITDSLGKTYSSFSRWKFTNDKSGIDTQVDDVVILYYDIQKLTTKELWLYRQFYTETRFEFTIL